MAHQSIQVAWQHASQLELRENNHFTFLGTKMPNMIPIAYLNDNLMDCNENLAWGKQEPLVHFYMFWCTTKGEMVAKTSFYIIFM